MSNWTLRAAQDWLKPVYECLHRELVKRQVLHADETTLQVLHEPGKSAHTNSYMWLYRTNGDTDRQIVLYEYQPNRKKDHPEAFLKGFSGYLHTDGYKEPQVKEKKPVNMLSIVGVIAVLIACGGGYFMMQTKKKKASEQRPDPDADYTEDDDDEYEIPDDDEEEIIEDEMEFDTEPEDTED